MIVIFLEEASEYVPPMKRDAGLRDLAQRLHLWPGDMAMELQRDALISIELLEKYVQQSLSTELKFAEKAQISSQYEEEIAQAKHRVEEMSEMKEDAMRDLQLLKAELKEQILKQHLAFSSMDLELHDLALFIPGFTSAQARATDSKPKRPSLSSGQGIEESSYLSRGNPLVISDISSERVDALAAVENFRDLVNKVSEELTDIVDRGSLEVLEKQVEKISGIQEAFESMGKKLLTLLYTGCQG